MNTHERDELVQRRGHHLVCAISKISRAFVRELAGEGGPIEEVEAFVLSISRLSDRMTLQDQLQEMEDSFGDAVAVGGKVYARHERERIRYHSLCGPLEVERATWCLTDGRNGPTVVAIDLAAGLAERTTQRSPRPSRSATRSMNCAAWVSDARDGRTWTAAVRESLAGYNVCLRAITRDGARAFDACAHALGVPAGPDLFLLQHAICKTTALPMAGRARRAVDAVTKRRAELAEVRVQRDAAASTPRGPGRPPDWAAREAKSVGAVTRAEVHAREMQQ